MDYQTAINLKIKNKHLIGKLDKGATIDELILVPTNANLTDKFIKLYLQTLDGDESILPFTSSDVDIVAVFDKDRIDGQGVFLHTSIFNLPDNLGVFIE